jgi:hypothetical protein
MEYLDDTNGVRGIPARPKSSETVVNDPTTLFSSYPFLESSPFTIDFKVETSEFFEKGADEIIASKTINLIIRRRVD